MKNIKALIIVLFSLTMLACSSSSDSGGGSSSVSAPSSLAGKVYNMTVTSGSGFFATTGTYTLTISNTQNLYVVTGDGINVADSAGSYTYTTSGNQGVAAIIDSVLSNGAFSFTFNTATSGTFLATAASDAASQQSGTFTE